MKRIIALMIIVILVTPITGALAVDVAEIKNLNTKRVLTNDVYIDGLYDNSTLYVGGDIKVKGYVDTNATKSEVEWQVTGNSGIIDFTSVGGSASIVGKSQGNVWVMARATDGSNMAREYAVNVKHYPNDGGSQALIGEGITPILKRPFNGGDSILTVEVDKKSGGNKGATLEKYLRKLSTLGKLSNKGNHIDDDYEYFVINTNSKNIEVRVDKKDSSYYALKNILSNVSKYNGGETVPPSTGAGGNTSQEGEGDSSDLKTPLGEGEDVSNKAPHPPTNESNQGSGGEESPIKNNGTTTETRPKDDITKEQGNITIIGGTGESKEDPLIIGVKDNISSNEKVDAIMDYIFALKSKSSLSLVRKVDMENYMSYVFKVSEKMDYVMENLSTVKSSRSRKKNDFFIEIRVDKNDKEAYESIIEMLDDEVDNRSKTVLGKREEEEIREEKSKEEGEHNTYLVAVAIIAILGAGAAFREKRT